MAKKEKLTPSQVGVLGAYALNKKLSSEQRIKNAKKAAKARWPNPKKV